MIDQIAGLWDIAKFYYAHGSDIVGQLVIAINALIVIAMLIPGAEPERTLQKVVDFLSKYSRKKKDQ